MVSLIKKILILTLVFIVGGIGGLMLPSWFISFSSRIPALQKSEWFSGLKNQTVIVNKTENVVVEQDLVVGKAYKKIVPSLVTVKSLKGSVVLATGQGFIVSSDGLVLTRREWISPSSNAISVAWQGNVFPAKIVKNSDEYGLVLLKIERSNLPVVTFGETQKEPGSFVVLVGLKPDTSETGAVVNAGIIKSVHETLFETTIKEEFALATGTPLLDLNGSIVGMNAVNSSGYVFSIPSETIKKFIIMP